MKRTVLIVLAVLALMLVGSAPVQANGGLFGGLFQRRQRVQQVQYVQQVQQVQKVVQVRQVQQVQKVFQVKQQFVAPVVAPVYVQPVQAYAPLSLQYSYPAPALIAPVYQSGNSFETQQLRQKQLELELQMLQLKQSLVAPGK